MATSEGIPSSIDIEFLELNDNPYFIIRKQIILLLNLNLFDYDLILTNSSLFPEGNLLIN